MDLEFVQIRDYPAGGTFVTLAALKDFRVLQAPDLAGRVTLTVRFTVNGQPYLEEKHYVFRAGNYKIEAQQILRGVFPERVPDMSEKFIRFRLCRRLVEVGFQVEMYDEVRSVTFFLLPNTMDHIETDTLLASSFLTLQPREMQVYRNDRIVMTVCAPRNTRLMLRASNGISEVLWHYHTFEGGLTEFVVGFDRWDSDFDIDNINYLYFFLEGYDRPGVYGQVFHIDRGERPTGPVFYFLNSLGGIDMIAPRGEFKTNSKVKTETARNEEGLVPFHVDDPGTVSVNLGYYADSTERILWEDFLRSRKKYILENGQLEEVIVAETTIGAEWRQTGNMQFDYRKAVPSPVLPPVLERFRTAPDSLSSYRFDREFLLVDDIDYSVILHLQENGENVDYYYNGMYTATMSPNFSDFNAEITLYKDYVAFYGQVPRRPTPCTQGYIVAREKSSGREALAVVCMPQIKLVRTSVGSEGLVIDAGDSSYPIYFSSEYANLSFVNGTDYEVLVDDSISHGVYCPDNDIYRRPNYARLETPAYNRVAAEGYVTIRSKVDDGEAKVFIKLEVFN